MEMNPQLHPMGIRQHNKPLTAEAAHPPDPNRIANRNLQQIAQMIGAVITQQNDIMINPILVAQQNKIHPSSSSRTGQPCSAVQSKTVPAR